MFRLERVLIMAVFVAGTLYAAPVPAGSVEQVFGFSSEDFGGGGSSYLGVDTRDVTPDRLGALQLKEERGVEVTMVDQDSPAGKSGIKEHDVILTINGQEVESVEQLRRLIREIPPGRVVNVGLSRNGQPLTLKAQLADRKNAFNFHFEGPGKSFTVAVPPMPPMPAMPEMDLPVSVVVVHSSMRSGLMVENLTPQLGDFFGAKNGQGILVRSVEKGSHAEKAGFRAGDVIVRVNGEAITDSSDFSRALHGRKEDTVKVNILRDKRDQTLTLTLPQRKQSHLEESFRVPDIDADVNVDLSGLESDLAKLRPQIAMAMDYSKKIASEDVRRALIKQKEEWMKQKQDLRKQERELRRHLEELKKEIHQYADI